MEFNVVWTALKGYPIQYGEEIIESVNRVFNECTRFSNSIMRDLGRMVDKNVRHKLYGKTEDGYGWFGRLEYKLKDGNIAILFPWNKERSIGLYSTIGVSINSLISIVNKLTTEMNKFARNGS